MVNDIMAYDCKRFDTFLVLCKILPRGGVSCDGALASDENDFDTMVRDEGKDMGCGRSKILTQRQLYCTRPLLVTIGRLGQKSQSDGNFNVLAIRYYIRG